MWLPTRLVGGSTTAGGARKKEHVQEILGESSRTRNLAAINWTLYTVYRRPWLSSRRRVLTLGQFHELQDKRHLISIRGLQAVTGKSDCHSKKSCYLGRGGQETNMALSFKLI